jgi:hypothetical protein
MSFPDKCTKCGYHHYRTDPCREPKKYGTVFKPEIVAAELERFAEERGIELPKPKASPKPKFIYGFATDDGYLKVGMSSSPKVRLSSLQTGCPRPLQMVFCKAVEDRGVKAHEVESYLHSVLRDNHSHGEWFRATVADLEKAVAEIPFEALANGLKSPPPSPQLVRFKHGRFSGHDRHSPGYMAEYMRKRRKSMREQKVSVNTHG